MAQDFTPLLWRLLWGATDGLLNPPRHTVYPFSSLLWFLEKIRRSDPLCGAAMIQSGQADTPARFLPLWGGLRYQLASDRRPLPRPLTLDVLSVRPGVACWSPGDANYIARIVPQELNPSATTT